MRLGIDIDLSALQIMGAIVGSLDIEEVGHEAVTQATAVILNRVRTRFLQQVSPQGVPWEPSYAAFQRSFGIGRNGGGTLFDSGNLFHSIQQFPISPLEQSIATDVPYGWYHNFGTGKLPQREFMGFAEADYDIAMGVLLSIVSDLLDLSETLT